MDGEPKAGRQTLISRARENIRRAHNEITQQSKSTQAGEFSTNSRTQAYQQVDHFLGTLLGKTRETVRDARTLITERVDTPYYSFADMFAIMQRPRTLQEMSQTAHEPQFNLTEMKKIISPISGSIVLSHPEELPQKYKQFYTKNRMYRTRSGITELRGVEYAVSISRRYGSAQEKIEVMQNTLHDAIGLALDVNRSEISDPKEYLLYLGVLDYMKMHSQIFYHAITFPEREGKIPDEAEKEEYLDQKAHAQYMMELFTRTYYQALLGMEFDTEFGQLAGLNEKIKSMGGYLKEQTGDLSYEDMTHRFRYPEANQPLIIAAGAFEAAKAYPNTNIIIGVPTGGTESAVVTQLFFEQLHRRSSPPDIFYMPVSLHSNISSQRKNEVASIDQPTLDLMRFNYPAEMLNKNILIIDDNSSSGKTVSTISEACRVRLVEDVKVHVAEFDGRAFFNKHRRTFFTQEDSPTTRGIAQITDRGKPIHKGHFKRMRKITN